MFKKLTTIKKTHQSVSYQTNQGEKLFMNQFLHKIRYYVYIKYTPAYNQHECFTTLYVLPSKVHKNVYILVS